MTALTPKTSMPTRSTLGRLGRVALTGAVAVASLGLSGCYYPARTHATVTYSSAPQQQYHVVQAPTAQVYTSSQPAPVTTYVTQDGTIYAEPEPTYTVYQAPPPPRQVVVQQRAPSQGAVWVNGHWQWNGYQYIWVDGYWVQPQQGYTYVQPRWEQRGGAYVYVQGYQRPSRVVVRQPQHRTVVTQQPSRQTTVVVQPQQPRTRTVVVQPQPQPRTVVTQPQPQPRTRTVVVQPQPQPQPRQVVVQPQPQPRTRTVVVQPQPQPQPRQVTTTRTVQTPAGSRSTTTTRTTPAPAPRQQPAQNPPRGGGRRVYTPM